MKKGEVYLCNLPILNGDVIGGKRPCVIVSDDTANIHSSRVIIVPITTSIKRLDLPQNIKINLKKKSIALCDQVMAISKNDVQRYVDRVSNYDMKKIYFGILIELGLV